MAGSGKSARQAGAIGVMAPLKACMGTGRDSALRLRLAVVPAVLATLVLPAAALGYGELPGATVPGTPALDTAATSSIPEPNAPQAAPEAPAEKPPSPPEPPALPRPDVTSAPVVEAPTPVSTPQPAPPKAVTPPGGGDQPVDSVAKIVKESVHEVGAVTADPVGTTTKVVQDVQKDASNLAGLIGGGGPPGADVLPLSPSSELLPSSGLLSNLTGIVYGGATILGTPMHPVDGVLEQAAPVQKSPQSPFAASSFEPPPPPPGAHSGGSIAGGGSPSAVGPGPGSGPTGWDAATSDTAHGTGAIPISGDHSSPAGRDSAGGRSSVSSRSLAGVHAGIASPAIEGSGDSFLPLPKIPPMPKLPAMGSGAVSTSLLFGLASALAVMLALVAARSGVSRRLALEGGRPVGFARLLERPG